MNAIIISIIFSLIAILMFLRTVRKEGWWWRLEKLGYDEIKFMDLCDKCKGEKVIFENKLICKKHYVKLKSKLVRRVHENR